MIPGLVWPAPTAQIPAESQSFSALAAIAGRGTILRPVTEPYLAWMGRQFGGDAHLPWAALRQAGESCAQTLAPGEQWLCADPVSLSFSRDMLLLGSPRGLALSDAESAALIDCLNTHCADLGSFHAASPQRWYLRTRMPIDARFHPPGEVIGRPVAWFQPEGADARYWARALNEIQVVLYNHPVSQARQDRGLPAANGVWLWGGGDLASATLRAPADAIVGDDPLLRGLTLRTGAKVTSWTAQSLRPDGYAGHSWWHAGEELAAAALDGDFAAWRATLRQIDTRLLQPLWQAWREGSLQSLRLLAPSDKTLLEIRLDPAARWRFWRRPASAEQLAALLQPVADKAPA